MAFDADFVNSVFASEGEVESKVAQIMSEYNADINGLKMKNQELIGKEKEYKSKLETANTSNADFQKQVETLTEQLKSKSDDKVKEYYETQLAEKEKSWGEKYGGLEKELGFYKQSHIERLKNDAIAKGIDGIKFVDDSLKQGFIALCMARNNFEPTDVDGQTLFLNKDHKQISDVFKEFALSDMGKAFIANGTSGGGGGQSINTPNGQTVENPFKTGNLDAQTNLYRTNKMLAIRLAKEAGIDLN